MTVGYRIASGTDLDAIFASRVSAAAAATGFRDSSGVDLSQRYEPRGANPPTNATGFKIAGGTDLNMVFKVATGVPAYSMLSKNSGSFTGFSDGTTFVDIPGDSFTPGTIIGTSWAVSALIVGPTGPHLVLTNASTTPPNADTTWQTLSITGKFSDDPTNTVTRTATRNTSTYTSGTSGSLKWADWAITASASFINGNTYQVDIIHT